MRKTAQAITMKGVILLVAVAILLCITGCSSNTPNGSDSTSTPTIGDESKIEIKDPEEEPWKIDSVYENGSTEYKIFLFGPEGAKWEIGYQYGNQIVEYNDNRCILRIENPQDEGPRVSLWVANVGQKNLYRLTGEQWVLDYTVAYDTLYWYNTNREVWACSWEQETLKPSLYCEDALGVSPYTDEGEGAIVSPDRANWDGYGLPIYSPYGK